MAHYRSVPFRIAEAQRLADLSGVSADLLAVVSLCEKFFDIEDSQPREYVLLAALCESAIVRYGRTLASGVRSGVTLEMLELLDEQAREAHAFFKDARDKWIAHSVNTFEDNEVSVWLMPPERGPVGPYAVSVRQQRVAFLSRSAMESLSGLASAVHGIVESAIAAEKETVLALAQQVPAEQLYGKEVSPLTAVGREHPGKVRPKNAG